MQNHLARLLTAGREEEVRCSYVDERFVREAGRQSRGCGLGFYG